MATFVNSKTRLADDLHDDSTAGIARAGVWLNRAMHEIVAYRKTWSWLFDQKSVAQVAAAVHVTLSTINSLAGQILSVYNIDQDEIITPLHPLDFFDAFPDPSQEDAGDPEFWTTGRAATVEGVYFNRPANTTENLWYTFLLKVKDLSADADTPPWEVNINTPGEWDHVWFEGARYYGELYNDQFERATQALLTFRQGRRRMSAHESTRQAHGITFDQLGRSGLVGKPLFPERFIYIGR